MSEIRTIDVLDLKGKKAGTVDLPAEVFDVETNIPLMHQVVVAQLAAGRQGTHATKTRGMVSGGGKKPFRHWRWHCPRSSASRLLAAHPQEDEGRRSAFGSF